VLPGLIGVVEMSVQVRDSGLRGGGRDGSEARASPIRQAEDGSMQNCHDITMERGPK